MIFVLGLSLAFAGFVWVAMVSALRPGDGADGPLASLASATGRALLGIFGITPSRS